MNAARPVATAAPPDLDVPVAPPPHAVRRQRWLMAAIIAVPALVLLATAFARFLGVRGSIDLAVFDQGIWNLSRGRAPDVSLIGESLLGDHFGPGFLLFALPYRLIASPLWLIGGQIVAAFAAAWLVGRRLAPHIGHRWAGAVGAGLLVSPPVAYAVLFDVHSVVFAVPFALAAIFALEDGLPRRAMLFGIAAAQREIRTEVTTRAAVAFPFVLALLLGPFLPPVADTQSYFLSRYWGEDTGEVRCLIEGIPDDAGVSAGRAITLLSHRQHLYLWPFPFAGTPASTLPAEHLSRANPELAARVDYLVVARSSTDPIPDGFELDADGAEYQRFRRTATTDPARVDCRS